MPKATNATDAWNLLVTGNKNFIAGTPAHKHQDAQERRDMAKVQTPFAAVFGCSDSRLAAEMIFDVGLGDLFVVRNAGQVIAETILGSLEFAVEVLKVPLILILGHDNCGAINATVSAKDGTLVAEGEYIHNLVSRITPTIERGIAAGETTVDQFTDRHIKDTMAEIMERSSLIAAAIESGKVGIVGAQYKLALGEVHLVQALGEIA